MTDIHIIDLPMKTAKDYDYNLVQKNFQKLLEHLKKIKRRTTKFVCVTSTRHSFLIYIMKVSPGVDEYPCTILNYNVDGELDIDPAKFLSEDSDKGISVKNKGKAIPVGFADELNDEYDIMKLFLAIFEIIFKHDFDFQWLKVSANR